MRRPNIDHRINAMRPRLRGVLHLAAAAFAPFATWWLLLRAPGARSQVAVAVYGACFLVCVGVSGAYHRLARTARSQRVFQRLDHAAIFLLVAGSYTPVALLGLPDSSAPWVLAAVWSVALLGILLKSLHRAPRFATALYLVLGWLALPLIPVFDERAGWLVPSLLMFGGVIYTIGAVLFLTQRPRLSVSVFGFHEFWHAMTLLAGSSHYLAVLLLLSRTA